MGSVAEFRSRATGCINGSRGARHDEGAKKKFEKKIYIYLYLYIYTYTYTTKMEKKNERILNDYKNPCLVS